MEIDGWEARENAIAQFALPEEDFAWSARPPHPHNRCAEIVNCADIPGYLIESVGNIFLNTKIFFLNRQEDRELKEHREQLRESDLAIRELGEVSFNFREKINSARLEYMILLEKKKYLQMNGERDLSEIESRVNQQGEVVQYLHTRIDLICKGIDAIENLFKKRYMSSVIEWRKIAFDVAHMNMKSGRTIYESNLKEYEQERQRLQQKTSSREWEGDDETDSAYSSSVRASPFKREHHVPPLSVEQDPLDMLVLPRSPRSPCSPCSHPPTRRFEVEHKERRKRVSSIVEDDLEEPSANSLKRLRSDSVDPL